MTARLPVLLTLLLATMTGCGDRTAGDADAVDAAIPSAERIAETTGFMGPESVRYDAELDVYFVGNFNGGGMAADNNGFISRLTADGDIDSLRFIQGGRNGAVLHAPRGMTITGDTLWACDVDAVRGFDRRTGAPVAVIDFSDREAGFLNDVVAAPDGSLYVTDTGRDAVYRIAGRTISTVKQDSLLDSPNGITWDPIEERFVVVPYGGTRRYLVWTEDDTSLSAGDELSGAQMDGVEVIRDGALLISTQSDSSLHVQSNEHERVVARLAGRPADIGYDPDRHRVAVPYIARNVVELWQLPE